MSLDSALLTAREAVADCQFTGLVDLDLGMMLGLSATDALPQDFTDNLAAGVVNFLDSAPVVQIEAELRGATGTEAEMEPYFQDIVVGSAERLHLYLRLKGEANHVLCFICGAEADPAGALRAARAAATDFSAPV